MLAKALYSGIFLFTDTFEESCMASYAENLKAKYLNQSLPAEGLLEHSNQICRLAMIQKEKVSHHEITNEFVQQTITGKVDDILHMKKPVELQSIFKGVPHDRKIVLIEGAPGAGKSSLSLNICKKWSEGELFQEYKAVILVRLRDPRIQEAKSIAELLPHCEKSTSLNVESEILATNGDKILWVLDGWDEFPDQLKNDDECLVRNLIYKQNHNSSVIVTSRPISSVKLHPLVSRRIEVLGFTSDELRQYFEYRLNGDIKSVDILLEKIKEYPEVQSSCYLPLHAGFIADTFLTKKQDLPSTQYGIFETVIVKCISRYQIKQQKKEIDSLEHLPQDMRKNFSAICSLAYKGTLENKIIFTERDLPSDFKSLDLLQEVESMVAFKGSVSRTYNFLHLSVQEFLAAQQLARKQRFEQYWLFRGLMEDERCLPMLTFYAAKTKLQAPGIADFVSKVGYQYVQATKEHEQEELCGLLAFVFKCICETEDPSICKPLVLALTNQFFAIRHIYDYYSLGSFLSLSSCAKLNKNIQIGSIKRYSVQDHEWNLFVKGLLRFYKGKCTSVLEISSLCLAPSDPMLGVLKDTQLVYVSVLSINRQGKLSKVSITSRKRIRCGLIISDSNEDLQASELMSKHESKQLGTTLTSMLQNSMVGNLSIEQINVFVDEQLAGGLKDNLSLSELHLVNCNISPQDCKVLCTGLAANSVLKVLNLSSNTIASGIRYIADALLHNSSVTDLLMCNCKIKSQDLLGMTQIRNIKALVLSHNDIGNEGAKHLAVLLKDNECLLTLVLNNCEITYSGSGYLLPLFQRASLKTLQISVCSIDQYGVNTLADSENTDYEYSQYFSGVIYPKEPESLSLHAYNKESLLHFSISSASVPLLNQLLSASFCSLQTLILSLEDLDAKSISSVFGALEKNMSLKYFRIKDGNMDTGHLKAVGDMLAINKSLITVILDTSIIRTNLHGDVPGHHGWLQPPQKSFRLMSYPELHARNDRVYHLCHQHWLQEATEHFVRSLLKNTTLEVLRLPHPCDPAFFQKLRASFNHLHQFSHSRLSILQPVRQITILL